MAEKYDVIVVGAGSAGLVAAWKAAEKGMKVLLVEKKSRITEALRTTGNAFRNRAPINGDYLSIDKQQNKSVIHFHNSDFDVSYSGRLIDAYDMYSFSNAGHLVRSTRTDRPQQYFFDTETLLDDLLLEAAGAGVELLAGALAVTAENTDGGVRLQVVRDGVSQWLEAGCVIAADGLNSRLAEATGLNKERPVMVRGPVLEVVYEGVDFPHPPGFAFVLGKDMRGGDGFLFVYPHAAAENAYAVMINSRFPAGQCAKVIEHFTTKSMFAGWFEKAAPIHKSAAVVTVRPPAAKPSVGRVLFIGDAPAFGETLVAGAMRCGYHAAEAVAQELDGAQGFAAYHAFWAKNFEFVDNPQKQMDYTKILRLYGGLTDEEIDYLFKLSQDSGPIDQTGQESAFNEYSGGNIMLDYFLSFSEVDGVLRDKLEAIRNS
ncbi:MAG: NAD(P)/FAD-dependent oxidoreductase [Deltaproteobacteria bacterium]|nr:NAD(P)/FAD-dependent oxidoreductase [Deltaproteobacteria bacterium]